MPGMMTRETADHPCQMGVRHGRLSVVFLVNAGMGSTMIDPATISLYDGSQIA
jgi:hypothetical protein